MNQNDFVKLISPYKDQWYRFSLGMTSDADFAKDCLQDLMEILWLRRGEINKIKNLGAYGYVIIRNKCVEFLKYRNKKSELSVANIQDRQDEEEYDNKEEVLKKIKNLLQKLPQRQKEVFILRELEGLKYDELMAVTGLNYENLRANLSLARKKLKQLYTNNSEDET